MIIYKIENKLNGKIYIGQSQKDIHKRIAKHLRENRYPIQKALNKHGLDPFIISAIDGADTKEAIDEKEKYWIKFYDCKAPKGYNCTDGGDGITGCNRGETFREKMRLANIGKYHSEETKAKMSAAQKGKSLSEETKRKIAQAHIGMGHTEETRKKIGEKAKGKQPRLGTHHTEEAKAKMRLKVISEAQKQRLREINLGKHPTEEARRKMRENNKARGKHSWNYGLTKETDERVANNYKRAVNQ